MSLTILDVSAAQGVIGWKLLAASGKCDGVIVKATEGQGPYVDPQFNANFDGALGTGLLLGTYHFAHPDETANDAAIEARHYVSTVLNRSNKAGHYMPLLFALDVEEARKIRNGPTFTAWCRLFVETVEALTDLTCWIYTGGPFWNDADGDISADDAAFLAARPLWIAAYVNDPTRYVALTPWLHVGPTLHQWSGDVGPGNAPGIRYPGVTGNVIDTNRYTGTMAQLRALIGRRAPMNDTDPLPPPPDTEPETPTGKSSQTMRAVRPEEIPQAIDFVRTLADPDEPKGAA